METSVEPHLYLMSYRGVRVSVMGLEPARWSAKVQLRLGLPRNLAMEVRPSRYSPTDIMEQEDGFEPTTLSLENSCATNCAIPAKWSP